VDPGVGRRVQVAPDPAGSCRALARHIARRAREAVRDRGRFSWVLAGGRTPIGLYELLAGRVGRTVPWRSTEAYFGDERCVPPDDPESNYGTVRDAFLAKVPIPPTHVHRLEGEVRPPSEAAKRYARLLRGVGTPEGRDRSRFDLVVLGVGNDGHTASLFPGSRELRVRSRTVVAVPSSPQPPKVPRLTLTLPALASSREVCFLVAGEEKAAVVARIFRSFPSGSAELPASLVRSDGPTTWFLDRAAASRLPASALAPGSPSRGPV
jgi:6-phosphogluconolactonase